LVSYVDSGKSSAAKRGWRYGREGELGLGREGEEWSRKSASRRMPAGGRRGSVAAMLDRLRALASRTWLTPAATAALAFGLIASVLAQIWLVDDPSAHGWGGPRWLSTVVAAAAIVPVRFVRRRPVPALAVSFGAGAALNVVLTAPAEGAFQTFVAAIVLAFGVGAYVEGRMSVVAIYALLAATVVVGVLVRLEQGYPSGEFVPILVWFGAAWLVGRSFVRGVFAPKSSRP
jgi:hypothetical protein